MGLLTNAGKDLVSVYAELGLEPYLDFVVTSEEAGEGQYLLTVMTFTPMLPIAPVSTASPG